MTGIVRWIDTDVMIADPLTKVMEQVVEALKTNTFDMEQPLESVVKKRANQLPRRSTKKCGGRRSVTSDLGRKFHHTDAARVTGVKQTHVAARTVCVTRSCTVFWHHPLPAGAP